MKNPLRIVQGKVVDGVGAVYHRETDVHPPRQSGCRDVFWGLLFYAHLMVMLGLAVVYGPEAVEMSAVASSEGGGGGRYLMRSTSGVVPRLLLRARYLDDAAEQQDDSIYVDTGALLTLVAIAAVVACIVSSLALAFMMTCAEGLIKTALIFNIVVFAVLGLGALATGSLPAAIIGLLMFAFALYFAYCVWSRIPFAASNLRTAITAVRANIGLALYAYISLVLLLLWTILWGISSSATLMVQGDCDGEECNNEINGGLVFLFLLSYYWTAQVITNVVHVTTAGTVGTWWFAPKEANGCCSSAVRNSYVRSLTTSFGSICLGSLIVAIIQAIRAMVHSLRENGDSLLACCAECLLGCIESLVEYFNKWAYVYVGLYGFSFMEAGSNVMTLFRQRGWTTIITDMIIDTVLSMMSLGVGALTALIAFLVGSFVLNTDNTTAGGAALGAFVLGWGVSATLFSVVSSAVNTVIVCYAEAPNEFQAHHPELSTQMRSAWHQAFPNEFRY